MKQRNLFLCNDDIWPIFITQTLFDPLAISPHLSSPGCWSVSIATWGLMWCITYYASIKARRGFLSLYSLISLSLLLLPAKVAPPSVPIVTTGHAYRLSQYQIRTHNPLYGSDLVEGFGQLQLPCSKVRSWRASSSLQWSNPCSERIWTLKFNWINRGSFVVSQSLYWSIYICLSCCVISNNTTKSWFYAPNL